jgi:hypothetical protein
MTIGNIKYQEGTDKALIRTRSINKKNTPRRIGKNLRRIKNIAKIMNVKKIIDGSGLLGIATSNIVL